MFVKDSGRGAFVGVCHANAGLRAGCARGAWTGAVFGLQLVNDDFVPEAAMTANKRRAPTSNIIVRVLIPSVLAVGLLASNAQAGGVYPHPHPRRPVDAATFDALLSAVTAESFADGKIERIRAVASEHSFSGGQAVTLLATFDFWIERLDALRATPLTDRAGANAVLRYFSGAPATIQTEAQHIIDGE
jgi:hypothetical protein